MSLRTASLRLLGCGLSAALSACGGSGGPSTPTSPTPTAEERLSQAGLYTDIASKTVAPQNRAYTPQYVLWSDGGIKRRWLSLPAGSRIDTTDMDRWVFPVGTTVFKEFSFQGRRVETRIIQKVAAPADISSWTFKAFAWRPDESDAVLVPEAGQINVAPTAFGTLHDIPSVTNCRSCHTRGGDVLLSVDALQMSADRDPMAIPEGQLRAGDITVANLAGEGLLTTGTSGQARVAASSPGGRWAIGYLHGNCGNCHNPAGTGASIGMNLRYSVSATREQDAPVFLTAVNRLTTIYQVEGRRLGVDSFRILGGSPEVSAIFVRMRSRVPGHAMPPIGSEVEDTE